MLLNYSHIMLEEKKLLLPINRWNKKKKKNPIFIHIQLSPEFPSIVDLFFLHYVTLIQVAAVVFHVYWSIHQAHFKHWPWKWLVNPDVDLFVCHADNQHMSILLYFA